VVLACLAYVDLNAVRAAISETPEDSDYTSIQRQIRTLQGAYKPSGDSSAAARALPYPRSHPSCTPS